MPTPQIPRDLNAGDESSALAYWRGHMDARMEDLSSRVNSIETKVDEIHKAVNEINTKLNSKEATDNQTKSFLRWLAPDSAVAIALIAGVVALAFHFVP